MLSNETDVDLEEIKQAIAAGAVRAIMSEFKPTHNPTPSLPSKEVSRPVHMRIRTQRHITYAHGYRSHIPADVADHNALVSNLGVKR